MEGEVAKRNLYEAATTGGEVERFVQLLKQDPYLVDVASFSCSRNILHIATMHRQAGIVVEITRSHPQLARELDSQKSSPLHIAAGKGYVEIVVILLGIAPEMCWWRDGQGMNPIHIAAMNGNVQILTVLIAEDPLPAMEKSVRGQSVLHLCLKHQKLEALQYLVETLNELVDVEDDDGDTVLHSAVRLKQVEAVQYLVGKHRTYELPTNSKGKTVHQICSELSRDDAASKIDEILSERISYSSNPIAFRGKLNDITMVVVVLIATMAFQAAVNPPGGVWPGDASPPHKAGEAVMAFSRPRIFKNFAQANSAAFFSSLIAIILLTTGLPSMSIFFMMLAMCATWVSLASISISYVASMIVITPHREKRTITHVIYVIIAVAIGIYAIFSVSSLITFGSRIMAYKKAYIWRKDRAAARP